MFGTERIDTVLPRHALFVLSLSLLSLPAARAERIELSLGGGADWTRRQAVNSLTNGDSQGVVTLRAAALVPELSLAPGLRSEFEVAWDQGQLGGTTYQRIHSTLSTDTLSISARLRRVLGDRVGVFGKLGLGLSWGELTLAGSGSDSRSIRNADQSVASLGAAGVDVAMLPGGAVVNLLARFELGYAAHSSLHFQSTPAGRGGDRLTLATESVALGSVNLSGLRLRLVLGGRF